jgi:hypothetical protein
MLLTDLVAKDMGSGTQEEVHALPFGFSPNLHSFRSENFLCSIFGADPPFSVPLTSKHTPRKH